MTHLRNILDSTSWTLLLLACATLGLAPFFPEPDVWEKLKMLFAGDMSRPIDVFDFLFHGFPWLLLVLKAVLWKA